MAEEKDAFYVVKKGDVVGIYKSFTDIQPLLASSVSGDSISIYKGFSLPKKSEEYLVSHGLKGAPYSIGAANVHEGLFGRLVACPYQDPYSTGGRTILMNSSAKSLHGATQFDASRGAGSSSLSTNLQRHHTLGGFQVELSTNTCSCWIARTILLQNDTNSGDCPSSLSIARFSLFLCTYQQVVINIQVLAVLKLKSSIKFWWSYLTLFLTTKSYSQLSCILEFDGASKGNPGPAGAGAILRAEDGSKVYRLREGVGTQTNNVAEYRALILGMKQAIKKGYKHIRAQGDSLLVCNQIQGLWKTKNQNMAYLCNEAKELKDKFLSFKINHVPREYNSEADVQANRAINLQAGQVEEDCEMR